MFDLVGDGFFCSRQALERMAILSFRFRKEMAGSSRLLAFRRCFADTGGMDGEQFTNVSALIASAIFLGLMVLSAAQGFLTPLFRRFFILNLSLFIWNAGLYIGGDDLQSAFSYGMANGGILLFCFTVIDFTHRFLGIRARWADWTQNAAGAISLAAMIVLLALMGMIGAGWIREAPARAAFDYGANALTIGSLGYCVTLIFVALARTHSSRFRNRLLFIAAAVVVGFVAANVNLIANLLDRPGFPASRVGMILGAAIAAYAILRRNVLNFEMALRRALAVVFYAALCLIGARLLSKRFAGFGELGQQLLFLAGIGCGLVIWILPARVIQPLTKPLRRALYPERFGPGQARVDFSKRAPSCLDRVSLAREIVSAAYKIAPFRRIRVAMYTSAAQWIAFDAFRIRRSDTPIPRLASVTPTLKALISWTEARIGSIVVEDIERAGDRLRPDSADRLALDMFSRACRIERVDLAVGGAEGEGSRILLLFTYDRSRQRLPGQTIAAIEAMAAESVTALHRMDLLEQVRKSERLAALGQMASGIAHEIKNPLSAIRGAAQALEASNAEDGATRSAGGLAPEQQAMLARIIREETDRLDMLVNDFLAFSRDMRLDPAPANLNELVRKTMNLCRLREDFKTIRIELRLQEDLADLEFDEERVHQTLLNLLGNAAEAMDGAGMIVISTRAEDGGQALEVADSGPGVPVAARSRLFEPFFSTKTRGAGLGLAISRKIAEAHGGSLEYLPNDESATGSVFRLFLPGGANADMIASKQRSKTALG